MAQRTKIFLIDDVDGSEATQTITFAYQGESYEIDLNEDHAQALEESFRDWVNSARKVTNTRGGKVQRTAGRATGTASAPRTNGGRNVSAVREWLRAQGHQIKDRGRVPAKLLQEYDAAH